MIDRTPLILESDTKERELERKYDQGDTAAGQELRWIRVRTAGEVKVPKSKKPVIRPRTIRYSQHEFPYPHADREIRREPPLGPGEHGVSSRKGGKPRRFERTPHGRTAGEKSQELRDVDVLGDLSYIPRRTKRVLTPGMRYPRKRLGEPVGATRSERRRQGKNKARPATRTQRAIEKLRRDK